MIQMTKLPNAEFRKMVPMLREKDFYEHEEPKKISWPEYNLSQIKDAQETLEFIRDQVDRADYSKPALSSSFSKAECFAS